MFERISLRFKRAHLFGLATFLVAAVCGVLAFLQYRWIREVAAAEQERLHQELQRNLDLIRRDFDGQLSEACRAVVPSGKEVAESGREKAYLDRYRDAEEGSRRLFKRLALAIPEGNRVAFFLFDAERRRFERSEWPAAWAAFAEKLGARPAGSRGIPAPYRPDGVVEFPRFADAGPGRRGAEQEWLVVEFDREVLRGVVLPALLERYLTENRTPEYGVVVTESADPGREVLRWGAQLSEPPARPDAVVTLFEPAPELFRGPRRDPGGPPERPIPPGPQGAELVKPPDDPGDPRGLWTLSANHAAGSLEALTARARRRNLLLAAGLLSLLIATVMALGRSSRAETRLAEMQMEFVTGVSHELRTPLAVIRAAGFNLHSRFAHEPKQVVRYGQLIEEESKKLGALVEQVLRYGSAEAGRVIGARAPVEVKTLIEESLPGGREALLEAGTRLVEKIEHRLPPVEADRESLEHALRNLIENAVKHGGRRDSTVLVSAARATLGGAPAVSIGILDHGPGIPKEERELVFQAFFRGKLAAENQVHGTGLGLHLARRIVEAHGGTLVLRVLPGQGTEFLATIPAAAEEIDESAHSPDRGRTRAGADPDGSVPG
jgi:signal transduction histidine kinase